MGETDEIPNPGEGGLNILKRDMATCKTCGLRFMVVDWLAWRTEGYCSEACRPWRGDETQSTGKEAVQASQSQAGTAQAAGDFAPAFSNERKTKT